MKLAVIILVLLGCLAAGAAVILVDMLVGTEAGQEVEVLVAAEDLPPLSKIEGPHVKLVPVAKAVADQKAHYLVAPVQAIGEVLSKTVSKGQLITASCFLSDEEAELFSTEIPEGMRALTIPIPAKSVMSGLLFPHCRVDIYGVFNLGKGKEADALGTEILQGVEVLAIEGKNVVSEGDKGNERRPKGSTSSVRVTFALTPDQTKVLQLSLSKGDIYVALRNWRDPKIGQATPVFISEGTFHGVLPATLPFADPGSNAGGATEDVADSRAMPTTVEVIRGSERTFESSPSLDPNHVADDVQSRLLADNQLLAVR